MARIRWTERFRIRGDMKVIRSNYRTVYALYPIETACTACGSDDFTDSAYNVSCATCGGLGYTLSWDVWQISGRIKQIDVTHLMAEGVPPGIEFGDAELYVSLDAKKALAKVLEENRAYVYFDGQRFRPTVITADGVGRADEWRIELKRFTPEARPVGY